MEDSECIDHGSCQPDYRRTKIAGQNTYIHRLICALTHGLPVFGDWVTCHTCDNKRCIRVEHLVAGTYRDNTMQALDRGLNAKGVDHSNAKLTHEDVRNIRASSMSQRKLAAHYGVSKSAIQKIKAGESYATTKRRSRSNSRTDN